MLFVAKKPINISSNAFLSQLKKRFTNKTLGFSGTLDPFASGVLVIADKSHSKLFSHFTLSPKTYIATLWLGATSQTLDITSTIAVSEICTFDTNHLKDTLQTMLGRLTYTPPKFSAKKIAGKRAYKLARENIDFTLKSCEMEIFSIEFLSYNHPFLSFKVSVSKGAYIRSLGEIIAKKLGVNGILSSLSRIKEGKFIFEDYKMLNPLDFLPYKTIHLPHLENDFYNGRKVHLQLDSTTFANQNIIKDSTKNTRYIAIFDKFFSIIHVNNGCVEYILNRIELC